MTKIAVIISAAWVSMSLICLNSAGAKQTSHAKAHRATRLAAAVQPANSGEWTPSSSLLIKLASETPFESYALRLPLGFTQVDKTVQPAGSATLKQFIYAGQKRSDKTFPVITVLTLSNLPATTSAGEQAQLDKALDNVEQTTTEGKPNLVISPREYGEVNGLPLVREYFKFSQTRGARLLSMASTMPALWGQVRCCSAVSTPNLTTKYLCLWQKLPHSRCTSSKC